MFGLFFTYQPWIEPEAQGVGYYAPSTMIYMPTIRHDEDLIYAAWYQFFYKYSESESA